MHTPAFGRDSLRRPARATLVLGSILLAAGASAWSPAGAGAGTVFLPFASGAPGAEAGAPSDTPHRAWGLQLMMEPWPEWHDGDIEIELPRARAAGLTLVRTNLRWDDVEPRNVAPESFDWTLPDRRNAQYTAAGFELLVTIVAYPKWATTYRCGHGLLPGAEQEWRSFVRAAAERYGNPPYKVRAWEIGNEPDGESVVGPEDFGRHPDWGYGEPTTPYIGCWGDRADAYRVFLQAAYEEIRAVAPTTPVLLGSLAHAPGFQLDFLDELLEAGGGPYFDVLGLHWFPDARYEPPDAVERFRGCVETMARHNHPKPIWLTETYRLTHPDFPHTEANQIPFLTRELVTLLAQPELEHVLWYGWLDLPDGVSDGVGRLARGIVRNDHTPKAAFAILPTTIAFTDGVAEDISTDELVAYRFQRGGEAAAHVIAWSRSGEGSTLDLTVRRGSRGRVLRYPESVVMAGHCCEVSHVHDGDGDGHIALTVGRDARFVEIVAP